MIIQCTDCGNRLAPDPRYAGSTTSCPVCNADVYVPIEDGDYGGPNTDAVIPLLFDTPASPASAMDQQSENSEAVTQADPTPVASLRQGLRPLTYGGWLLCVFAVGLKLFPYPTTTVLSWGMTFGAVTIALILLRRRKTFGGAALLLISILIPSVITIVAWKEVENEVEAVAAELENQARQMDAEMKKIDAAASRALNGLATSMEALGTHQARSLSRTTRQKPRGPDWSAARAAARLAGTLQKEGLTYAIVNGIPVEDGKTTKTSLDKYDYTWRVKIAKGRILLIPITSHRRTQNE